MASRRAGSHADCRPSSAIKTRGLLAFGHIVIVLAGTAAIVALFIVVPIVTAYLLLDFDHLKAMLSSVVPAQRWHATMELLAEIDAVIGGFIRGQLLVALIVGILITVAMLLLRIPYPFLARPAGDLRRSRAVRRRRPRVYPGLHLGGRWQTAGSTGCLVTVAFVVIYEVEGHFIAPNVVGKQVKLSAFIVIARALDRRGARGPLRHAGRGAGSRGSARARNAGASTAAKSKAPPVTSIHSPVKRVDIVGVPMDLGASRRGVDMGPSAVRYARLHEALRTLGIETIVDHGNLHVPIRESADAADASAKFFDVISRVCGDLAAIVGGGGARRRSADRAGRRSFDRRWERSMV